MNVFACHREPQESAIGLADRHIRVMPGHAVELINAIEDAMRGVAPPSSMARIVQAAIDDDNFRTWLVEWGLCVASEYAHRFGTEHPAHTELEDAIYIADGAPPSKLTWALADIPAVVDAEFVHADDPIASYRESLASMYAGWAAEGRPPQWTRRGAPPWLHYLVRLGRAA